MRIIPFACSVALAVLGLTIAATSASADPIMLVCVTANPPPIKGWTYQVVFDQAKQLVQLDHGTARNAKISDTQIEWTEPGPNGTSEHWVIDRLTGAYRTEIISGMCNAPPPRKF